MVRAFSKLIQPYARRILQMIGRGAVRQVDDTGALQTLQVTLLDGTQDALERFQEYGLAGNPPAGAEAVRLSVHGSPDHSLVIAVEHRRFRMKGLKSGEVALYDDQGQVVHLTRDGIEVKSTKKVTIDSIEINLGGERNGLLALIDERIVALINAHTHKVGSVPTTPPTTPITLKGVSTTKVKAG